MKVKLLKHIENLLKNEPILVPVLCKRISRSIQTKVIDDVGSRSASSLNNLKTASIDRSKQKNQVGIPVKVEI